MPDSENTSYGPAKSITWTPGNTKIATLNFFVVFLSRSWARLPRATASIMIKITKAPLLIRQTDTPVLMENLPSRDSRNYTARGSNIPYDVIDERRKENPLKFQRFFERGRRRFFGTVCLCVD